MLGPFHVTSFGDGGENLLAFGKRAEHWITANVDGSRLGLLVDEGGGLHAVKFHEGLNNEGIQDWMKD